MYNVVVHVTAIVWSGVAIAAPEFAKSVLTFPLLLSVCLRIVVRDRTFVPWTRLDQLNLNAACVHILTALFIGSVAIAAPYEAPLTIDGRVVASFPTVAILALAPSISAFFHIVALHRPDLVNIGLNPLRWTDYSLSATVCLVVASAVARVTSVPILVHVAATQWYVLRMTGNLEWLYYTGNTGDGAPSCTGWFVSNCIVEIAAWMPLVFSLFTTPNVPAVAFYSTAALAVCFGAFAVVFAVVGHLQTDTARESGEVWFSLLSLLSKQLIGAILCVGAIAQSRHIPQDNTSGLYTVAFVGPLLIAGIVLAKDWHATRYEN